MRCIPERRRRQLESGTDVDVEFPGPLMPGHFPQFSHTTNTRRIVTSSHTHHIRVFGGTGLKRDIHNNPGDCANQPLSIMYPFLKPYVSPLSVLLTASHLFEVVFMRFLLFWTQYEGVAGVRGPALTGTT